MFYFFYEIAMFLCCGKLLSNGISFTLVPFFDTVKKIYDKNSEVGFLFICVTPQYDFVNYNPIFV